MEKINKNNYEAYLLDFIEGNLGAEEQHDLFVFLAENPELKAAFEGDFGDVVLQPTPVIFENKTSLKVGEDAILSLNTVDAWMLESVEKNLNAKQEKQLADFVKTHQLEKTFLAYQSTRLNADLAVVYDDKKKLKVRTGIIIPLNIRYAAAAAAVIILLSVAVTSNWFGTETPQPIANSIDINTPDFEEQNNSEENPVMPDEQGSQPNLAETRNDRNQQRNEFIVTPGHPENELVIGPEKDTNGVILNPILPENNDIVNDDQKKEDTPGDDEDVIENDVIIEDEMVSNPKYKSEQPYKLITDAASDVINKEVYFSRQKDLASNEYVAYQFKLGSFEFERKKSR